MCLSIDFIFEGIPNHDSKNIYIQVGAIKEFGQHKLHSKIVFELSLSFIVSQTGLVSKPKSEGFGLAGQFPFTKRGMELNFLS